MPEHKLTDFRPALRRRVHEDVAEQLRDAILDGRFPVGSRLPPERELALEFQVNRTSIREAIKILEGLNLVRVRQGDGAAVQPLTEASFELLGAMILHGGRLDVRVIAELLEVVRPLVLEMARLALDRATPEQVSQLRALSSRLANERRNAEGRAATARDLLIALSDMTGNRVWQMLARRLYALLSSEPLRETRRRMPRDFDRLAALLNESIELHMAGHADQALSAMQRAVELISEGLERGAEYRLRASRQSPTIRESNQERPL